MIKLPKKKIILLSTILALVLLAVFVFLYTNMLKTFSIERWNENVYQRERMLDDFLEKYDLTGMSYDEVMSILGTNEFDGNKYLIGKSYVGPTFFSITFDDDNRVKSYGIIVD